MNDEEKQANCDEESDMERPLTWGEAVLAELNAVFNRPLTRQDAIGFACGIAILVLVVITSRLLPDLNWWQQTEGLVLMGAVIGIVGLWWESHSLPREKRPSLRHMAPRLFSLAKILLVGGLLLGALLWAVERYKPLQDFSFLIPVALFVWSLIYGARSRRKQRSG